MSAPSPWYRVALGWIGFVIGPLVGTLYWLLLKLVNGGKMVQGTWVTVPGLATPRLVVIHYESKLVRAGVTFGHHVWTEYSALWLRSMTEPGQRWHKHLRHEFGHVPQWERFGWIRFLAYWFMWHFRYGHDGNPLEIEARTGAEL